MTPRAGGPDIREPALDARLVLDAMLELVVFHEIVDGPDGRAVDYRILDCNPAFSLVTGIQRERAVGRLASEVYATSPPYLDVYARVAATGQPTRFDSYFAPLDRHFSISVVAPRPGCFITVATDVTERHRAAEELRRYQLLAEHGQDVILFLRREDGRILDANAAATSAYGYTRRELLALTIYDLRAEGTTGTVRRELAAADDGGLRFETVHRRKDGTTFPVEVGSHGATLGGDRVLLSVIRDVTDRTQAAKRLSDERERLAVTLQSIGDAVIVTDDAGRVTLMNGVAEQLTGWSADEALGRALREVFHIIHEETRQRAADPVERVLREGVVVGLANHTALVARDGSSRPVADSGAPIRDPDGRISGVVLVFRDQTEERAAQQAVRDSEARYRDLVQVSPDAILVTRGSGIVFANPACLELYGASSPEEVIGRSPLDFIHPDFHDIVRERMTAVFAGAVAPLLEERIVRRDGGVRDVEVLAAPLEHHGRSAAQVILRDVTARKRAEEERQRLHAQLAEAQKLESVGQLAGGIAHDFNNLLTVILSCAEVLKDELREASAPGAEDVAEIHGAALRARDLTRQLLAFARRQVIAPVPLALNNVVRGMEKMLRRVLREDIELTVRLEPGLWTSSCDPGQLEQVLLNLAVNARDAMPHGGRLLVETRNGSLRADEPGGAAECVQLIVSDSGVGMSEEVKRHLFEPFFTTKPHGQGTGLGLATVYGIVKQSGGHVRVESEPGRGTTVEVRLPRHVGSPASIAPTASAAAGRGTETILVVEDEPRVREVTVRALRSAGYRVLAAASGAEALRIASNERGEIQLLVTDVIMPALNGRAVADALRQLRPGIRVLFVSGYTHDTIAHHGVLDAGVELLPKPFTPSQLLQRVRAVLDAPQVWAAGRPG